MASAPKKDNSTFDRKRRLRQQLLAEIASPIVMETYGGFGVLFEECYRQVTRGVVFDTDPAKTAKLSWQRPTWAVYESDCVRALQQGVGAHLCVNVLDVDAWGEPWPALDAFFGSDRPRAETLGVVVTDGLRQTLKMNGGWSVRSLQAMVQTRNNHALYREYAEVCRELLAEKAALAGYTMRRWTCYHCGFAQQMTHYAAVLTR